jgi:ParB/RepB/Spo0J family partition protein
MAVMSGRSSSSLTEIPVHKIRLQNYGIREKRSITTQNSVRKVGLLQPIKVRPIKDDPKHIFEVVYGNGRLEGVIAQGGKTIKAIVEELDNRSALLQHITENLARENYDPIETAKALDILHRDFHMSTRGIAKFLGYKSHSIVQQNIALNRLPGELLDHVKHGRLTPQHLTLLGRRVPKKFLRQEAELIAREGKSLEETEAYLATQKPLYAVHDKKNDSEPEKEKDTAGPVFGPPQSFLSVRSARVESCREGSIWFMEKGREVSLHEKINALAAKADVGDMFGVQISLMKLVPKTVVDKHVREVERKKAEKQQTSPALEQVVEVPLEQAPFMET